MFKPIYFLALEKQIHLNYVCELRNAVVLWVQILLTPLLVFFPMEYNPPRFDPTRVQTSKSCVAILALSKKAILNLLKHESILSNDFLLEDDLLNFWEVREVEAFHRLLSPSTSHFPFESRNMFYSIRRRIISISSEDEYSTQPKIS